MAVLRKIFSSLQKLFRGKKQRRKQKYKARKKSFFQKRVIGRRKSPPRLKKRVSFKKSRKTQPVPAKTKSAAAKIQPLGPPIGAITHFFSKIQVVVVKISKGTLAVGDKVRIYGKSTDFIQTVRSMQIESVDVRSARSGALIGLKVEREARVGDKLYKLV